MLVEDVAGTLITVAKDVKVEVELSPAEMASYRLIGYENRLLRKEDFANDKVDAAEMGAGQTVTALYEIEPARDKATGTTIPLKYQDQAKLAKAADDGELLTVKIRYKLPTANDSRELALLVRDGGAVLAQTSPITICKLAERICTLAQQNPADNLQPRCQDARQRCKRAEQSTAAACGCGDLR